MRDYYLAVDIGASNGRHILSYIEDGKIKLEEIHRFENGLVEKNNSLCWDYEKLFSEIITGLKKCKELNKIPKSIGIDTWGVDFVLLDEKEKVLGNTVAYRDSRTNGMDELVYKKISEKDLYARTGIQKQLFNTIYQLMAIKENNPEYLEEAKTMLLVPDYLHYLLCGAKKTEYTNATTTQLVNAKTNNWDFELIEKLGYNKEIFNEIVLPKTELGNFTKEIQEKVGFDCKVVAPATHDTGSAIVTLPYSDEKSLYISSGTWSLMGVEENIAHCDEQSQTLNFTNEGGYDYRFRYLKNIMGLWIIQSVRHELNDEYDFAELCNLAETTDIKTIINCNDDRLLSPKNMIETIKELSKETNQQIPESVAEISAVVYKSLAKCYDTTVKEIETLTNRKFENIYIVGGGAKASYLNKLTAETTGKRVKAVPIEATALGNILVQMISDKVFVDLFEARECVKNTFEIETY